MRFASILSIYINGISTNRIVLIHLINRAIIRTLYAFEVDWVVVSEGQEMIMYIHDNIGNC